MTIYEEIAGVSHSESGDGLKDKQKIDQIKFISIRHSELQINYRSVGHDGIDFFLVAWCRFIDLGIGP